MDALRPSKVQSIETESRGFGMAKIEGEQTANILSILTPEEVAEMGGLPSEAIVGSFLEEPNTVASFRANPKFLSFLQTVISTAGPSERDLQAAAAEQGEGWVYVTDGRSARRPNGEVPFEDIIGGFKVECGTIVPGRYWANTDYRPFTAMGLIDLPEPLREVLLEAFRKLVFRRQETANQ